MGTKKMAVGVAVVTVGLVLSACGGSNSGEGGGSGVAVSRPDGEPIIIGMDEDSTGPGASFSTVAGKTVRDTIDDINNKGGILGRPVDLVVENDESDPTKTPSVVRKLVDRGAAALILQTSGGAISQAKSVVQNAGVIALSPTTTSPIALPPDNAYIYTLANPASDWIPTYCGAFQKTGAKNVAVLSDTTVTINAVNEVLLPGLGKCTNIVTVEKAPANSSDLTAQVARIKSQSPDAVLVSSAGGSFEVLAHNTIEQQIPKTPRFSLASIGNTPDAWKLANPGALDGLVFMGSIDKGNTKTQEVAKLLARTRGKDYVPTAFDSNGYDTVQLIKIAIEKAGGITDKTKLRDAMNTITKFEASFGQPGFTLSYSADKHVGADGLCGLVLTQFGSSNKPKGPWSEYQPPC